MFENISRRGWFFLNISRIGWFVDVEKISRICSSVPPKKFFRIMFTQLNFWYQIVPWEHILLVVASVSPMPCFRILQKSNPVEIIQDNPIQASSSTDSGTMCSTVKCNKECDSCLRNRWSNSKASLRIAPATDIILVSSWEWELWIFLFVQTIDAKIKNLAAHTQIGEARICAHYTFKT